MKSYDGEWVQISDEEGNEYELERLFDFDLDGEEYAVLTPLRRDDPDGVDPDTILMRIVYDRDEECFEPVPDEAYDRVNERFMEILFSDEE